MPTSRADVISPDAARHATELVADLAAHVPAVLHERTTELRLAGGQLHVTPANGRVRLEAVADDDATLRAVEREAGRHLAQVAGPGVLALEWWTDSGGLRRDRTRRPRRYGPVARALNAVPPALFRKGYGHLLGTGVLELTHSGRRSGRPRKTVLQALRYDPTTRAAIVMVAYGRGSDWYLNLHHSAPLRVRIGKESFVPTYRELGVDEAAQVLALWEREHRLSAFAMRLLLSRTAGWRYHGTAEERRRLVAQLPLLELRPLER